MTIYTKQYFDEIVGELMNDHIHIEHFILSATKQTIINRLISRGEMENSWAEQHIDICINAFDNEISGKKINTEFIDVDEIASVIIENINLAK